jgi:hypothetical protein
VQDDGPLATSYAAVKPGTVFSPLTGERLYAGAPIVAGAAAGAAGLAGNPSQAKAATMPTSDEIVQTMLGNQPAQPQPLTFDDHMERIRQFWAGQGQPSVLNDNPRGYGNGPPTPRAAGPAAGSDDAWPGGLAAH